MSEKDQSAFFSRPINDLFIFIMIHTGQKKGKNHAYKNNFEKNEVIIKTNKQTNK